MDLHLNVIVLLYQDCFFILADCYRALEWMKAVMTQDFEARKDQFVPLLLAGGQIMLEFI